MHRKTSKRRQLVMRTFVYALMTASVVTIVAILMLVILGYSFNRQDGKLEQGGLLQFASIPSGATVTLDGIQAGSRTPSKANVDAKDHHVQMDLKGYRSWKKSINVAPGGIGWLSYARLIPNDVKVDQLHTFPALAASLAATDRKWIIAQENTAANAFTLINIEPETPKVTNFSLPDSVITPAATAEPQAFTLQAWSDNSDRVLVKRIYDSTKTEWIVVDRQRPAESVNVTTSFAINAKDVRFGERNGSDAYILTDDAIVRRVDLGNKTLSGPLAENVNEFSVYDNNTVVYVTNSDPAADNKKFVGYREDNMDAPQTIFSYPAQTTDIHVALGEYYGKNYVGVTHDRIQQVFVGSLPKDNNRAKLKELAATALSDAPLRLNIGENGRLVVAEMANSYTTFDVELEKSDTTTFTRIATKQTPLRWLDNYVVISDREGAARLYEFDGANQQDIMPVIEGQALSFSGNDKFLYGFTSKQDGTTVLVRGRLVIN